MSTMINYLSLTGLNKYDVKIKEFIAAKVSEGNANSFKYVNLENGVLKFYTVNPITEDTVADFEITLPEQDLSNLMTLVKDATAGNVATFGENGQVVDSGIKASDLATKSEVQTAKDEMQAEVDAVRGYLGNIPDDADSTNIVAYINEKAQEVLESATGGSSESAASVKLALDTYKAENDAKVNANATEIENIKKDYLTSDDKKELQDKIDANESAIELLTNGVNSETIDGVNDLITYVNEHGAEVTKMQSDIAANAESISSETLAREAAEAAMKAELEGKIAEKANSTTVDAIDARLAEAEGKAHVHGNADVINAITAEKVTAWDNAEGNAIAYTDEKLAGIDLTGIATNASDIDKLEASLAEGGATATAIANAQAKADEASASVGALETTHAEDKAALEAKDAEIEESVSNIKADVDALKEVQHVEITEEQIDALFV